MAAIVNAVWDLYAKAEGKPLWKLLADMSPAEIVPLYRFSIHHRRADSRRGARHACREGVDEARASANAAGVRHPAYTTSAGWIGYSDERIVQACNDALRKAGRIKVMGRHPRTTIVVLRWCATRRSVQIER